MHVPLVIVGAGACGLVAALWARQHGAQEVVILERESSASGSTAMSSGFVPAAGTRMQLRAGVADSPALFARDIQDKAGFRAHGPLLEAYTREIGPVIDVLSERYGIDFELLQGFLYPGHSLERMHALPQRTGAALLAALLHAVVKEGVDIVYDARVIALNRRQGGPHSAPELECLHYQQPGAAQQVLGFDALVLACNGYGGNRDLVARYIPAMKDAWYFGHAGNQGDAIDWAAAIGARLADMSGYQGHGSLATPHGVLITWALLARGAQVLNLHGERFFGEGEGYSEAAEKVCAQPQGVAYSIFDQDCLEFARGFPDFCEAERAGAIRRFENSLELAEWMHLPQAERPPEILLSRLQQLGAFPRYAVRITGALFHTQGGLDVTPECALISQQGLAFANTWAAGGAARGVSGPEPSGYLSGNGLLSALAGGAIAGRAAASRLASR